MFNFLVRTSLNNRLIVLAAAALLVGLRAPRAIPHSPPHPATERHT